MELEYLEHQIKEVASLISMYNAQEKIQVWEEVSLERCKKELEALTSIKAKLYVYNNFLNAEVV